MLKLPGCSKLTLDGWQLRPTMHGASLAPAGDAPRPATGGATTARPTIETTPSIDCARRRARRVTRRRVAPRDGTSASSVAIDPAPEPRIPTPLKRCDTCLIADAARGRARRSGCVDDELRSALAAPHPPAFGAHPTEALGVRQVSTSRHAATSRAATTRVVTRSDRRDSQPLDDAPSTSRAVLVATCTFSIGRESCRTLARRHRARGRVHTA